MNDKLLTDDGQWPAGDSDTGERIIRNQMLSELILDNLDVRSLHRISTSSREWLDLCGKISSRRKNILSVCYAYDFSASNRRGELRIKPAVQLLHTRGLLGHDYSQMFEYLTQYFKSNQWSRLRTGFLFHGGGSSRSEMHTVLRPYLPPDCNFVAITSCSGVIPSLFNPETKTFASTEIQGRGQLLTAVSYLLLPELGFDVTFFDDRSPDSIFTQFEPKPDNSHKQLKCVIIFASECVKRVGRREVYTSFEPVNRLFAKYQKGFAMGGIVVDRITRSCGCDRSRLRDTKFTGVAFSGQNLQTASGIFDTNDLDELQRELLAFKHALNFNTDVFDPRSRTIGFLLTCSGRGPVMFNQLNAEIDVINRTFPAVLFTGLYGDGEFGENYWPLLHSQGKPVRITEDSSTKFWHFYTNVIVLLHFEC